MKGTSKHRGSISTGLLIVFVCVTLLQKIVSVREDNAERAELEIKNSAEVPVAVHYRGHYKPADTTLLPEGSWQTPFREWDVLRLETAYAGLKLSNKVLLTTSELPTRQPRQVHRELYIVHEVRAPDTGQLLQAVVIRSAQGLGLPPVELKPGRGTTNIVCW